jgi:hypothetical protein
MPFIGELAGVPADQFAIADFMTVELQAWNSVRDRFQHRLALDEVLQEVWPHRASISLR